MARQDSKRVIGTAEANDAFGDATAVGDFNHDGFFGNAERENFFGQVVSGRRG